MKTLHFQVFDQAGEPTPATLSVSYSWDVLMDDGTVFSSEPRRYYASDGVFNIPILAADDPNIEPGYEAFTMTVSWAATVPDCNGRMSTGEVNTRTVQVVMADPEPVLLSDLVPADPADMGGVWHGGIGDGGVKDHGALTGLLDDDHPQYALADGSRGSFHPPDATIVSKGIIQLSGDLAGTAGAPIVPDLALLNDMADLTIQFENGLV